jgi:hypothetical protein
MSGERLVTLLTEIRDQQKRQVSNFEQAIEAQNKYLELQRKGRQTFLFMIYAPWAALAFMTLYVVFAAELL